MSSEERETKRLSFCREELNQVFGRPDYSPESLIALFETDFGTEFAKSLGIWEGYSLKEHTLMAIGQFEKYFSSKKLPANIDANFFRIILALHDIGKPASIQNNNKNLQHEYTINIIRKVLSDLGFSAHDINIASALILEDPIGEYLKYGDIEGSANKVKKMAEKAELPIDVFLDLLLIFYKADAGSYTEDAGGCRSLDRLFVFDQKNREMKFAPDTAARVEQLKAYIKTQMSEK